MNQDKNFHEGHRERLISRFLQSPDSASDHELLEILLFSALPRKDTNIIAHRLVHTFGGIHKVFEATPQELMSVDGVGKRVAGQIILVGQIMKAVLKRKDNKPLKAMNSFYENRQMILDDFAGVKEEQLVVYLLDSKYRKLTNIIFENNSVMNVVVNASELAKAIALHKPKFAIIAHNHPSGNSMPSAADDVTTKKIYLLCSLHGVDLVDHIIVAKENVFSYHIDGKMELIKESANLNKILEE